MDESPVLSAALGEAWDARDELLQFLDAEAGSAAPPSAREATAIAARRALIASGVDLAEVVHAKYLRRKGGFAYYHLPIPLSVLPPPGTTVTAVEVQLQLNPGSRDERPAVHDIFPRQEWQDVMRVEGGLKIGIDESLRFAWALLSGTAGATVPFVEQLLDLVSLEDLSVSTEYSFLLRKPLIATSIDGSDIALWRFSGRDHFERAEHMRFGVVLAVPLGLKTVRIAKTVRARRRNQSLRTLLAQDLERLQAARALLARVFAERKIDAVIETLSAQLRSEWNVVQEDLPIWNLDADLRH